MSSGSLAIFGPEGRMLDTDSAAIYLLIAEQDENTSLVKIGFSTVPYKRYVVLLTGIPFGSLMIFSWCGTVATAKRTERALHTALASYHSVREWFRVPKSESENFHRQVNIEYAKSIGKMPDWKGISEEQAVKYSSELMKPYQRKYQPKRGRRIDRRAVTP